MRQPIIIATTALVTALIAIWGTTVLVANPQKANFVPASVSIDVMQMMKDAKNLPDQRYDAY